MRCTEWHGLRCCPPSNLTVDHTSGQQLCPPGLWPAEPAHSLSEGPGELPLTQSHHQGITSSRVLFTLKTTTQSKIHWANQSPMEPPQDLRTEAQGEGDSCLPLSHQTRAPHRTMKCSETQNFKTTFLWIWEKRLCQPTQKTWVPSLGREYSLKKERATHSSLLV